MDDHDVVGLGEGDDLAVDLGSAHRPHRVRRQRDDHVLRAIRNVIGDVRHVWEKVVIFRKRIVVGSCARKQRACPEDRVAGIGYERDVTRVGDGGTHVLHALLGAGAAHDHVRRDAQDAVATLVVVADSLKELVLVVQGVLPVGVVCRRVHERPLDVVGRREVGRADGEVKHSAPLGLQLTALLVEVGKDLVAEQVESLRELHGIVSSHRAAGACAPGAGRVIFRILDHPRATLCHASFSDV